MHNVLSHFHKKRYQKMWLTEKPKKKTFSFSIYPGISRKNYEGAGKPSEQPVLYPRREPRYLLNKSALTLETTCNVFSSASLQDTFMTFNSSLHCPSDPRPASFCANLGSCQYQTLLRDCWQTLYAGIPLLA